jgi:uncharacterized membrane protein (UPF0136 family)
MSWIAFGWLAGFFFLIGGYYVLRYRVRRHPQSLFIAGLTSGWVFFGALVAGLMSHTVGLALALAGGIFGTVFLLAIVDELRRGAVRKG